MNDTITPVDQTPVKNVSANVNLTLLREDIVFNSVDFDLILIGKQTLEESRSKLQLIKEKEREKRKKAAAINNLEAFIFDTRDRLSQDDFVKCSSEDEREQISAKLSEADNWLMDADNSVETKVLFNIFLINIYNNLFCYIHFSSRNILIVWLN